MQLKRKQVLAFLLLITMFAVYLVIKIAT